METKVAYRDPTPEELESPLFNAVWNAIKGWDISRTSNGLYSGATGTDVCIILDAIARHASAAQLSVEDCNKAYTDLTRAANEEGSKLVSAEFSDNDRHLMLMERYRGRADVYLELSQRHAPAAAPASEREAVLECLEAMAEAFKEPAGGSWWSIRRILERDGYFHEDIGNERALLRLVQIAIRALKGKAGKDGGR